MTLRSCSEAGATPAPGRFLNDRPPEPASAPPQFFTKESRANSATFRDLDSQERQSDLSWNTKEMWTKALAEPGHLTTNPMDDLIPGKQHIIVLAKWKDSPQNATRFTSIIDRLSGLNNNYTLPLTISLAAQHGTRSYLSP